MKRVTATAKVVKWNDAAINKWLSVVILAVLLASWGWSSFIVGPAQDKRERALKDRIKTLEDYMRADLEFKKALALPEK